MSRMSIATIKSPEFINITSVSPMISKCEIKVMYLGGNRNRSYIDKEVATEMAQTLPGTPIVGYYSEKKEDFGDHGEQMVIDGDGLRFNCLTKPYGFVPTDTRVWFKEFEDTDEFGNKEIREYLMCEGYLWTEQYKEAQKVINEGRPHSMELDENTLKGYWSEDTNRGIDFFIVNSAIFSKLCILGEDVEPCFEGSSVTTPDVSATFSLDTKQFTKTLYSMMNDLKALTYSFKEQGGTQMENDAQKTAPVSEPAAENFTAEQDKNGSQVSSENDNITGEFKKEEKENDKKEPENKPEDGEKGSEDGSSNKGEKPEEKEDDKKEKKPASKSELNSELEAKYSELEAKFTELSEKYSALEQKNNELVAFKNAAEDKEKDALIAQFYMLSDEDKADVIANKAKYSLDDIESKLSVICVRKKVTFDNGSAQEETPATTFNLNSLDTQDDLPAWLKAVEENRNR